MSNITAVTPFALTAKGLALQHKVQAGLCKLELVGVKIGDGYLQEGQTIESLTSLVHEIPTADGSTATESPIATLAEVYKDKDTKGRDRCMVHVYIRNGNNDSTRITECAILAKDTDGSTIIYGAINLGDSSMPFERYNGTTPIVYNWKFPLYISNEANINMSFGFLIGVSREDFEDFRTKVVNSIQTIRDEILTSEEKDRIKVTMRAVVETKPIYKGDIKDFEYMDYPDDEEVFCVNPTDSPSGGAGYLYYNVESYGAKNNRYFQSFEPYPSTGKIYTRTCGYGVDIALVDWEVEG